MAVRFVHARPEASASIDQDFVRSSSRSYWAYADIGDAQNYVAANSGFRPGEVSPDDAAQFCVGVEADLAQNNTTCPDDGLICNLWNLTVRYGYWNPLERSYDGDPTHIRDLVTISTTFESVIALLDVDGNPIVNSAGDPYDPPLERERLRMTINVRRNVPGSAVFANPAYLQNFMNTVNRDPWPENAAPNFPAKTVRCTGINPQQVQYCQLTGEYYYPTDFTFDINPDTWTKQVYNQGLRELAEDGSLQDILIKGVPTTKPVFLDGEGHAILTPEYEDAGGDSPPTDDDPEGGGGQPPSSSVYVNAYDVLNLQDFSVFNMANIFNVGA